MEIEPKLCLSCWKRTVALSDGLVLKQYLNTPNSPWDVCKTCSRDLPQTGTCSEKDVEAVGGPTESPEKERSELADQRELLDGMKELDTNINKISHLVREIFGDLNALRTRLGR